jgi:hypothetical protein
MRLTVVSSLAALAIASAAASPQASATRSESQAAPSYPNTRLAIRVKGRPRAGSIATVVVTGDNERMEISEGSGSFLSYNVDLFVQNPRVLRRCPLSYSAALENVINLGDHISQIGRYMNAGDGGSFRLPVKYQTGNLRRVVFCAYTRVITDDAAVAGLRHTFAAPRARR